MVERLIEVERRREADELPRPQSDVVAVLQELGGRRSADDSAATTPAVADRIGVGRVDIPTKYPADYLPSTADPPDIEEPHTSPEKWAEDVNPDRTDPGRDNNCGECARACEDNWLGRPTVAAAMRDPDAPGELIGRMIEWADFEPRSTSITEIGDTLREQDPGSSAVVGCDWSGGGGHWFNAVNDKGQIKAVDDQSGEVEPWPPSHEGLGFDQADMEKVDAIVIDGEGRLVEW